MQTIFTNIKCIEIMLRNATEHLYVILYNLVSQIWYIATAGPYCKDATHMQLLLFSVSKM